MPCDGSYMNPNRLEKNLSVLYCCLDELDGKKVEPSWRTGYHPAVYCQGPTSGEIHDKTAELCEKLQNMSRKAISKTSLELQMWWRDHQEADRKRVEQSIKAKREHEERKKAIAKLTPYERNLLGLKEEE